MDHLSATACLLLLLQLNGVFVGLDALGATFRRGVPFLLLAVVAFVVAGTARPGLRRAARIVGLVAIAALLVAVGLLPGLLTFVRRSATPAGLALLAGALASGFVGWRTYQPDIAYALGATGRQRRTLDGLLFVSPNLIGFVVFFVGPLLFSLWVSFHEWDAFAEPVFTGFANYVAIARDPLFWRSVRNVLIFTALGIPLSVIPAMFFASLLNARVPGVRVFRAIYFIPAVAGVVAVALIWRQLLDATVGWVNYLLDLVAGAWNALPLLPAIDPGQPQWLSDADLALISLVVVFAWQYVGFNTVLFLAGLQGVDQQLYEAAMLDGANQWQRFRHVTLPQLAPTTFFVVASMGINALQLFGEAVVLFPRTTPIGAGPENSALTPVVYLYDQGFRRFSFGYASAVAWVLFALIFTFTFIQFRRQREAVEAA